MVFIKYEIFSLAIFFQQLRLCYYFSGAGNIAPVTVDMLQGVILQTGIDLTTQTCTQNLVLIE